MRIHLPATVLILGILGTQTVVYGQLSGSSSSGLFGNRTIGGGITAGNRTFGGSGTPGGITTSEQGNVGQVDASARYIRGSQQSGAFVGTGAEEVRNFLGAVQAGENRTGQSLLGRSLRGTGGTSNANRQSSGGSPRRGRGDVRTSLRVAFDYPRRELTTLGTGLAVRLAKTPRIRTVSAVKVEVREGTATLRGVVATDHDRDLCERLARLEAGIWDVNNEILVEGVPAEAGPASPE